MHRLLAWKSPFCMLACTLVMCGLGAPAFAQQVRWRHDYNIARREAEDSSRPLVIDFGTENCFWCKKLDQTTFLDADVIAIMNEKFIPLKIDASREASLAGALQIHSYPTIVLATPDGRILDRLVGYKEAGEFYQILKRTLASVPSSPPTAAASPPTADPKAELQSRDYQEATKAIATSDYSRAIVLLKGILEENNDRSVQLKAKQLLNDIEQQAAGRLARARLLQDKGQASEAIEIATDLMRAYPGTQAAVDASKFLNVLSSKPDIRNVQRAKRARDLLAQAREDYRTQQFLCCLDRCELLAASYADLAEGMEAIQLASEIKNNPEWMRIACESLSDRLGLLYLSLAETWIRKGDPEQAAHYLERVVQSFPGSRQAEAASIRLSYLKGQPNLQVEFKQQP